MCPSSRRETRTITVKDEVGKKQSLHLSASFSQGFHSLSPTSCRLCSLFNLLQPYFLIASLSFCLPKFSVLHLLSLFSAPHAFPLPPTSITYTAFLFSCISSPSSFFSVSHLPSSNVSFLARSLPTSIAGLPKEKGEILPGERGT